MTESIYFLISTIIPILIVFSVIKYREVLHQRYLDRAQEIKENDLCIDCGMAMKRASGTCFECWEKRTRI